MTDAVRDDVHVRHLQQHFRELRDAPPTHVTRRFDGRGAGAGTWIAAFCGLLLVWPGLTALVLAGISQAKGNAAQRVFRLGDEVEAERLSSTADGLRIAALILGLVPIGIVLVAIAAIALLGRLSAEQFSTAGGL